jgi:hypothetical protein
MNSLAFVFAALKTNLRLSVEFRYSVLINIIVAVIKQSLFLIAWYFFSINTSWYRVGILKIFY